LAGKNLSPEETSLQSHQGAYRLFLLLAVFFIGVAIYEYDFWTKWEARVALVQSGQGPWIDLDSSVFTSVYDRGGKWAVVGLNLFLAVGAAAVSAFLWRTYRKMWRASHPASEPGA
jgi:hypothetical protein